MALGMAAEVMILTGARTVLDDLLRPAARLLRRELLGKLSPVVAPGGRHGQSMAVQERDL